MLDIQTINISDGDRVKQLSQKAGRQTLLAKDI